MTMAQFINIFIYTVCGYTYINKPSDGCDVLLPFLLRSCDSNFHILAFSLNKMNAKLLLLYSKEKSTHKLRVGVFQKAACSKKSCLGTLGCVEMLGSGSNL